MSKVVKAPASSKPGGKNPDNAGEVWALCTSGKACPEYPKGRYITTTTPIKLAKVKYKQRCHKCAQRERQQNPETRSGRRRDDEEVQLPSGTDALLGKRTEEHFRNGTSRFRCGICRRDDYVQTWEGGNGNKGRPHFCDDCTPWATLALKREHYGGISSERETIYTKIKILVEALRSGVSSTPAGGPDMPFWELAEVFKARYLRRYTGASWRVENSHFRHAVLFFGIRSIKDVGNDEISDFQQYLLSVSGPRGRRSSVTAVKTIETLRRILSRAVEEGWLEGLPSALGQITRTQRITGHILTLVQNNNGHNEAEVSAKKQSHGGARHIKLTADQKEEFVSRYDEVLPKIRKRDLTISSDVLARLALPGNSPSDVARDYIARLMGIESNDYLRTVITQVRKSRKQNALHSSQS